MERWDIFICVLKDGLNEGATPKLALIIELVEKPDQRTPRPIPGSRIGYRRRQ